MRILIRVGRVVNKGKLLLLLTYRIVSAIHQQMKKQSAPPAASGVLSFISRSSNYRQPVGISAKLPEGWTLTLLLYESTFTLTPSRNEPEGPLAVVFLSHTWNTWNFALGKVAGMAFNYGRRLKSEAIPVPAGRYPNG